MFRKDICHHVRKRFHYDVRWWLSRGGAWETTFVEDLAFAPQADNMVMSPHGNRLALQSQMREPTWLQRNAEDSCGG